MDGNKGTKLETKDVAVMKFGYQLLICIEFCKALDVCRYIKDKKRKRKNKSNKGPSLNHFPCNDWISNRTPSLIS